MASLYVSQLSMVVYRNEMFLITDDQPVWMYCNYRKVCILFEQKVQKKIIKEFKVCPDLLLLSIVL